MRYPRTHLRIPDKEGAGLCHFGKEPSLLLSVATSRRLPKGTSVRPTSSFHDRRWRWRSGPHLWGDSIGSGMAGSDALVGDGGVNGAWEVRDRYLHHVRSLVRRHHSEMATRLSNALKKLTRTRGLLRCSLTGEFASESHYRKMLACIHCSLPRKSDLPILVLAFPGRALYTIYAENTRLGLVKGSFKSIPHVIYVH